MNKSFLVFLLFFSQALFALSPTERYLAHNALEEIKQNMRLEGATFEQKPIFDKAAAQEAQGFFGYFAASAEFRTYQDLIRLVFEEQLGQLIPKEFHFLAVPLYPKRSIKELSDINQCFFVEKPKINEIIPELFPFNLALYASHNSLGFCPARNFSLGTSYRNMEDLMEELSWLFERLGLDPEIIRAGREIGRLYFAKEDRVLIQLFDTSVDPYAAIDSACYPAFPTGHPYKNAALSDYVLERTLDFPPQFFLLLHERVILNPQGPIKAVRFGKIQPTMLKKYEEELRALIRGAKSDPDLCQSYLKELQK